MNPLKQLAGQTAVYGMSSVIARILNYFLVPLYTRVFSTGEYGVVTELYAYVAILMVVLTYGLETGYFRFARGKEDENKVFSTALISLFLSSSVFLFFVILFGSDIASFLGPAHKSEFIIILGSVLAVDTMLAIPYARLRFEGRASRFAVYKTINISLNITLNLFFLLALPLIQKNYPGNFLSALYKPGFGVGYIFLSNLVASSFNLVFFVPGIFRKELLFSSSLFRKMIVYSLPLLVAGLGGIVNETIDRVLLKFRLLGEVNPLEQLGIYGANIKIAVFMALFVQMYRYAAEPFFFQQHRENKEKFLENYALVNRVFIYTGLLIFMGIVFFLDVFQYFIGHEFREGLGIVPIVLFSNLLLGVFFNLSFWYKFNDKTVYGAYITLGGALLTIGINYLLIPVYGYYASAWAHVICNFSMVVISWYFSRKYLPADFKPLKILLVLILAFVLIVFKSKIDFSSFILETFMRIGFLLLFLILVFRIENIGISQIIKTLHIKL